MKNSLRFLLCTSLFLALGPVACAADTDDSDDEGDVGDIDDGAEALSTTCKLSRSSILAAASGGRETALERGFGWYDAHVPYSQSKYYKGYRTDCSGFISMCWETGKSYTTASFINGSGANELIGSYENLKPGDALVHRKGKDGHVVLFLGWNDSSHSSACVLEQASTKLDMQFRARTTSSLKASGYKAIRADKF